MLIDFREREKEGERQREKHQSATSRTDPDQGLNPQPRHTAWLGIEPLTLQFMGQCSNQLSHTSQGQAGYFLLTSFKFTDSFLCHHLSAVNI